MDSNDTPSEITAATSASTVTPAAAPAILTLPLLGGAATITIRAPPAVEPPPTSSPAAAASLPRRPILLSPAEAAAVRGSSGANGGSGGGGSSVAFTEDQALRARRVTEWMEHRLPASHDDLLLPAMAAAAEESTEASEADELVPLLDDDPGFEGIDIEHDRPPTPPAPPPPPPKPIRLGWVRGVTIPTCEFMWSVLIFVRFAWIVGNTGLLLGLTLIAVCAGTVAISATSVAAVATNGLPRDGVVPVLTRTLGSGIGGAIALIFGLGVAIFASVEVVGSVEGLLLASDFPWTTGAPEWDQRIVAIVCLTTLVSVALLGHKAVFRLSLLFMVALIVAFSSLFLGFAFAPHGNTFGGRITGWSWDTLNANLLPHPDLDTTAVLTLLFPCFLGIFTGVNNASTLRNPYIAIPRGSLAAIATSATLYAALFTCLAAVIPRDLLLTELTVAPQLGWPLPHLAIGGLFLVGNGSALHCIMLSSQVLCTLFADRILPRPWWFPPLEARGSLVALVKRTRRSGAWEGDEAPAPDTGGSGEPRVAVLFCGLITLPFVFLDDLETLAVMVAMCFLLSYAFTNLSCTALEWLKIPEWRPVYRGYHWALSLTGAAACITLMFRVNALAAATLLLLAAAGTVAIQLSASASAAARSKQTRHRAGWGATDKAAGSRPFRGRAQQWGHTVHGLLYQIALNHLLAVESEALTEVEHALRAEAAGAAAGRAVAVIPPSTRVLEEAEQPQPQQLRRRRPRPHGPDSSDGDDSDEDGSLSGSSEDHESWSASSRDEDSLAHFLESQTTTSTADDDAVPAAALEPPALRPVNALWKPQLVAFFSMPRGRILYPRLLSLVSQLSSRGGLCVLSHIVVPPNSTATPATRSDEYRGERPEAPAVSRPPPPPEIVISPAEPENGGSSTTTEDDETPTPGSHGPCGSARSDDNNAGTAEDDEGNDEDDPDADGTNRSTAPVAVRRSNAGGGSSSYQRSRRGDDVQMDVQMAACDTRVRRRRVLLHRAMEREGLAGFVKVFVCPSVRMGQSVLLQTVGLGELTANTVLAAWPDQAGGAQPAWAAKLDRVRGLAQLWRLASVSGLNVLVAKGILSFPDSNDGALVAGKSVDVWWIVNDGPLILLVAYILRQHPVWRRSPLRLFAVAQAGGAEDPQHIEAVLRAYLLLFRIPVDHVEVVLVPVTAISATPASGAAAAAVEDPGFAGALRAEMLNQDEANASEYSTGTTAVTGASLPGGVLPLGGRTRTGSSMRSILGRLAGRSAVGSVAGAESSFSAPAPGSPPVQSPIPRALDPANVVPETVDERQLPGIAVPLADDLAVGSMDAAAPPTLTTVHDWEGAGGVPPSASPDSGIVPPGSPPRIRRTPRAAMRRSTMAALRNAMVERSTGDGVALVLLNLPAPPAGSPGHGANVFNLRAKRRAGVHLELFEFLTAGMPRSILVHSSARTRAEISVSSLS
ncbi:hypothetical protein H9P43_002151 [Blastocladiella emersonii ATCC 22665]|nr:hypothetical protein H9P43_002151 [Blastocladiella emersonii ATCC 22665]